MLKGFEDVLKARLNDALFLYQEDLNTPLSQHIEAYKHTVFHEKIGTLQDKVERLGYGLEAIQSIVNISAHDYTLLKRAIELSKADLFTHIVREFPELQGIMGNIYACHQGENLAVAHALEEHYQPLGPQRDVPQSRISYLLALLDKCDTLVGFFGHHIRPTSTKDPLAIRRTAIGILRLWEQEITTNTNQRLTSEDLIKIINCVIRSYSHQNHLLPNDRCEEEITDYLASRRKGLNVISSIK